MKLTRDLECSYLERANYAQPEDPPVTSTDELDVYGTIFQSADSMGRRVEVDRQSAEVQLNAIGKAAGMGDFVIAYMHHHHWEPNWQSVPDWVQTFARACVDSGASLFVSHGAPVLQAMELYRGSPIFFGLGNFFFHTDEAEGEWQPRQVWESIVAACHFDDRACLAGVDLLPVYLRDESAKRIGPSGGLVPRAVDYEEARRILGPFADRSRQFGDDVPGSGVAGRWSPVFFR